MRCLHIDYEQFEFISNRGTSIISLVKDSDYEKIEPGMLIQIVCNSDTLIAEVYKKYVDFEEIQSQITEFCLPEIIKNTNDNIWLKIFVYRTECSETTALVPATLLLYRNIQWLRHLQLKRRLFKYIPAEKTRTVFNNKIEAIEQTIAYLKGDIDIDVLCELLSNDKDDTYNYNQIIEFLRFYSAIPKLNDFRRERLAEINNAINDIKRQYSEKNYLAIRQTAYDIHNVPEIIRTINDYRRA